MLKRFRPAPQGRGLQGEKTFKPCDHHTGQPAGNQESSKKNKLILMGQKVNPISNRLGIIKGWDSNWYGGRNYSDKLVEDYKIREYLTARLAKASISKIIIERTLKLITVTVNTARPGIIIGKGGQEVDKLKEELKKITNKEVQINIFEVKRPELDAMIVANNIARQIEGKVSTAGPSRWPLLQPSVWVLKESSARFPAGWAELKWPVPKLSRRDEFPCIPSGPISTMLLGEAHTKVGLIGVKVWICKGEIFGHRDLAPNIGAKSAKAQKQF